MFSLFPQIKICGSPYYFGSFFFCFFSAHEREAEGVLDTLAFGVGFFEFLGGALEVGTEVLQLRCHLLLEGELLHVDGMVRVGGDGRVGVLLPREGLGPADDE